MTRTKEQRIKKYDAKVDASVFSTRIAAYKNQMVKFAKTQQAVLSSITQKVKQILNDYGIPSTLNQHYIAIANELYSLIQTVNDVTLENEAKITLDKWTNRTRSFSKSDNPFVVVIVEIAKLFGISYIPPVTEIYGYGMAGYGEGGYGL